ncbi:MAG: hypothetical protein ACXV8O_01405 [Methylobacter sp.]
MSLADGFAQGFGLVDAALQRRQANETMAQKVAQDQADHAEEMQYKNKELGLKSDELASNKGLKDAQSKYYAGLSDNMTTDNKLARDTFEENKRHNGVQEGIGISNANTDAKQTQAAIDEHKADVDTKKFELEKAKSDLQKQKDAQWLMGFSSKGQDGDVKLNIPDDKLEEFDSRSRNVFGTGMSDVAAKLPERQQALTTIQQAVTHPERANKQQLLASMNLLDADTINKGIGKFDGPSTSPLYGGVVERKEITDILSHPADDISPVPYYTGVITQYGKNAKGQEVSDSGPLTQFRSSNPNDKNVRVITEEDLVKHYAGHEALNAAMADNPAFKQRFASLYKKDDKVNKEYQLVSKKTFDPATNLTTEEPTGAFNKDTGRLEPFNSDKQPSMKNDYLKKAQKVLANPDNYTEDQVNAAKRAVNDLK